MFSSLFDSDGTNHSLETFGEIRNPQIDLSDGIGNVFEKNVFSKKCFFLFHTAILGRSGIFFDYITSLLIISLTAMLFELET